MQRLLAARGQKQSVMALLSSGIAVLFQFALFLMVGIMLWAYYRVPSSVFGRPDRIYPTFIVTRMPHGISGVLIAAILAAAMSNLSAALNSLSSSAIMDFYARLRPHADEKTKMRLSRLATLLWALVLFGLAIIALHKVGRVVEVGLQIASVAYGALLGVFLLGVLTRRANQNGAMVGMAIGFAIGTIPVARHARPVDMVGHDWHHGDIHNRMDHEFDHAGVAHLRALCGRSRLHESFNRKVRRGFAKIAEKAWQGNPATGFVLGISSATMQVLYRCPCRGRSRVLLRRRI